VGSGAGRSRAGTLAGGDAGTTTCSAGAEAGEDAVVEEVSDMVFLARKA
jgi:hypothetical protein